MNQRQKELLQAFDEDEISLDELDDLFEAEFGIDLYSDITFLNTAMDKAIAQQDAYSLDLLLNIVWIVRPKHKTVPILNKLLLCPLHRQHQAITKQIQTIADPSSIVPIVQILQKGFKDFEYTCSEDGAIAKWFSWALFSIGTPEAIVVLEQYSHHANAAIAEEMRYRLAKLK